MRLLFRATIATTLVASLGACSSTKQHGDTDLHDLPSEDTAASITDISPDASLTQEAPSTFNAEDERFVREHTDPKKIPSFHKRSARSQNLSLQTVAATPFQADGFWMNAFYFVRKGDTWENISNKLYGRPDRAELLHKWNPTLALKPGTVLYYNSPVRPEDSAQIKIFSEDFNQPLESIEVKAGESILSIARERFGSTQSWQEIAYVNPQLQPPFKVATGQVLNIQPVQIDTQKVLSDIVKQAQQVAPPPPEQIDHSRLEQSTKKEATAPPAIQAPSRKGALDKLIARYPFLQSLTGEMLDKLLYGAILLIVLGLVLSSIIKRKREQRHSARQNEDRNQRSA